MSAETIVRVDDITLAPGCRDEFVDVLRSKYVPGASARRLELVDIVLAPPVDDPALESDVIVTWRLADIDTFWQARRAAMMDPTVGSFWRDTADIVVRRTRRFAQAEPAFTPIDDSAAEPLPSNGIHHIVLMATDDAEVAVTPPDQVRRSAFGRHLPGSVGAPDASWEFDAEDLVPIGTANVKGAEVVDVVLLGDVIGSGARAPRIQDAVKRTLLLKVEESAPLAAVSAFERDLLGMPRHIPAIRNWRLARVGSSEGGWTHAWEQEYAELAGLRHDYMRSPYHWSVVDGWFDAEDPRSIVRPELLHLFYETPSSVLAAVT
ncbi:MAG: Dabb family protein [Acidimicrobiia bacterium]